MNQNEKGKKKKNTGKRILNYSQGHSDYSFSPSVMDHFLLQVFFLV